MYKDSRYGITEIGVDMYPNSKVSISWDYWDDENDLSQRNPTLLIIPDLGQPEHDHIQLTRQGAKDLRDWLNEFLNEVEPNS